jgi:sugar phosphate isomerase/epimerase
MSGALGGSNITGTDDLDVPSGRPATIATPRPGDPVLAKLSLNQKTTDRWSVEQAIDGCVRNGLPAIGLWREQVAAAGLERTAGLVAEAGLRVSSLCRGGFLTVADEDGRRSTLDDNRRAIDEAATLDAACLVLVVGGLPEGSRDLPAARDRVAAGIETLVPYAAERGVRLALEPLHPIFCADRAVLSTLGQALDLAERFPPDQVGVVVDTYHVWWDPHLEDQLQRARGRIASFQVCDWITPLPADTLLGRGMMGDGHIDLHAITMLVEAAGYRGDVEVEIFNAEVWSADPDAVVATMMRRYAEHVVRSPGSTVRSG